MFNKIKRFVRRVLKGKKIPYEQNPRFPAFWFQEVLGGQSIQVVQIGSNDGKTGDPLYPLLQKNGQWRALLVEPLPHIFSRLRANYAEEDRFKLANVAINKGEDLPFYYVDPIAQEKLKDLPYWYDQLGSFNRNHIAKELDGVLAPYIRSRPVVGICLVPLLEQYNINKIDILHIDAEGYDWSVLSQLPLDRFSPKFILFEYHHLPEEEFRAATSFLSVDFKMYRCGIDILAVNRSLPAATQARMGKQLEAIDVTKKW